MNCPICENNGTLIKQLFSGNFDQSLLYDNIKIICCDVCGHVYNELSLDEIKNLNEYYINEYSDCHNSKYTKQEITNIINQKDLNSFLTAVTNFNDKKEIGFSGKYEHIYLDQYIEHIAYPNDLFIDIKKHLHDNGYLTLGLPNSLEYINNQHFPNYMFLIREHIQHFDLVHMIHLANKNGFELVETLSNKIEILKNTYMPNIEITLKYTGVEIESKIDISFFNLKDNIKKLNKIYDINTVDGYCYGIGREFLYMYRNGYLKNIKGLIDNTPIKQNYTINNMKIQSDDTINKNYNILITAIAHKESIKDRLAKLKHGGTIK